MFSRVAVSLKSSIVTDGAEGLDGGLSLKLYLFIVDQPAVQ